MIWSWLRLFLIFNFHYIFLLFFIFWKKFSTMMFFVDFVKFRRNFKFKTLYNKNIWTKTIILIIFVARVMTWTNFINFRRRRASFMIYRFLIIVNMITATDFLNRLCKTRIHFLTLLFNLIKRFSFSIKIVIY